jgi:aryl-alcohol dehydrogenase-like predicted oxidoreductase
MKKIKLGSQGLIVPAVGLGTMGMTKNGEYEIYGKANEAEAIATIHRSLESGGNLLDTADLYGPFENERLIAKAIKGSRDKYIIASKFGYEIDDNGQMTRAYNGKKDYVKKSIERSLKNLDTDYIDLYYLHRLDPNTPIEETVEAMAALIKEGKIGYIGLSEVSSATIKRAHAVHPVTAVQTEYSLFERTVEEAGILDTLAALGIGFIAYSPLSRGFLTGQIKSENDFFENDFRKLFPRFQGEQLTKNIELVNRIAAIANEKSITVSQLAIAWVIAKGHLPIPGTKRIKYLEQNTAAADIILTADEMERLEAIVPPGTITGDRYDAFNMGGIDK